MTPWFARAVLPAAIAATAAAAASSQQPTFKARVDLVTVDVAVLRDNRPVSGLGIDDFVVLDDGVRQRLEGVVVDQVPLEVYLVLDISGSTQGSKLESLVAAANTFVSNLSSQDRAALVSFSGQLLTPQVLTGNWPALRERIDALEAGGITALYDATYFALKIRTPGPNRGVALVFTDGFDNASWLDGERVVKAAERSDVVVYGVTAGALETTRFRVREADARFLRKVCRETGGRLFEAEWGPKLKETFSRVLEEIRARYLLTYYPTQLSPGWHTLEVKLARASGQVVARRGYSVGSR